VTHAPHSSAPRPFKPLNPHFAERVHASFARQGAMRLIGAELIDVALRNAIDAGVISGPRMKVATMAISATGGHGDLNGFSPYLRFEGSLSSTADGIDEIRKAVRRDVKYGADQIKVLAGAGVLSEEESAGAPQYSQAELDALVQEAAMWGRKVAAHAHGAEAIRRAIKAGVASVDHAGLIDEEGVRLAKEHGTFLVPDIWTDIYILEHGAEQGLPEKIINKEREIRKSLEMRPQIPDAHYNLGLLYEEKGDLRRAAEEYRKEIEIHPGAYPAYFNLALLCAKTGDRQGEFDNFKEAVKANPRFARGHLFLAKAYLDRNENFDEAIRLALKGLELEPEAESAPLGHYVLADIYNRLGRLSEYRAELEKGQALEARIKKR